jgi:hypothetical protein
LCGFDHSFSANRERSFFFLNPEQSQGQYWHEEPTSPAVIIVWKKYSPRTPV